MSWGLLGSFLDSPDSETMRGAAEAAERIMAGLATPVPDDIDIDSDAISATEDPAAKEEAQQHRASYAARGLPSASTDAA